MKWIIFAAALFATPAFGQMQCGPRDMVLDVITKAPWNEVRRVEALAEKGVVEVYGNTETGTWTVIITDPNGMTCIRGSGVNGFAVLSEGPSGDPA